MTNAIAITEKSYQLTSLKPAYEKIKSKLPYNILAWFPLAGHVMTYTAAAQKSSGNWAWDKLPIIPQEIRNYDWNAVAPNAGDDLYTPSTKKMGGKTGKQRVKAISDFLKKNDVDTILIISDPDREGDLLALEVINYLGYPMEKTRRVWLKGDLTEESCIDGLEHPHDFNYTFSDGINTKGLYQASQLRSQIDLIWGFSYTQALTLKTGQMVYAGRVKLPTLALVVNRELEISNFKPKTFFQLEQEFVHPNGKYIGKLLDKDGKEATFDTEDTLKQALSTQTDSATIESVESKVNNVLAPQMFKTNNIMSLMAGKHYSFKQIQDAMESLYHNYKVMTYPRTDTRYMEDGQVADFEGMLESCACVPELKPYVDKIKDEDRARVGKSRRYVNSKKSGAHTALSPTKIKFDISQMTPLEADIIRAVDTQFVQLFLPAEKVQATTIITKSGDVKYKTTGKIIKDKGWTVLANTTSKDVLLPDIKQNDTVQFGKQNVKKGQTKPPAFYTDSTLITAMENVANQVDDKDAKAILKETKGLGTDTSQPEIIEGLKRSGLIFVQKNKLHASEDGINLIKALHGMEIIDPIFVAHFEDKLDQVAKLKLAPKEYQDEICEFVTKQMDVIKNSTTIPKLTGAHSKTKRQTYQKESTDMTYNGCKIDKITGGKYGAFYAVQPAAGQAKGVSFSSVIGGHELTEEEIEQLMSGKHINIPIKTKSGSTVHALIGLDMKTGKFSYQRDDIQATNFEYKGIKLNLYQGKNGPYYAAPVGKKWISFGKTVFGYELTDEDIKTLLAGESVKDKELTFKNGKSKADLILDLNQRDKWFGHIQLHFHEEPGKDTGITVKGKPVTTKDGKYGKYYIWNGHNLGGKWAGHEWTNEEIQKLFNGDQVHVKAKSKAGKEFETDVVYDVKARKITFVQNKK